MMKGKCDALFVLLRGEREALSFKKTADVH